MSSDREHRIYICDALSIRNAQDLATDLMAAIDDHEAVVVETGALSSVDVAILQVLIAAHKTARDRGVTLRIDVARDGVLRAALARSGIAASLDAPLIWDGDVWTGLEEHERESAA